ncbi:MAG: GNAT family N-acetyltransferase [Chloroflexi bacterium]|nr:GNAT family N-acetyltransferase [Chloroflexota bacterium]
MIINSRKLLLRDWHTDDLNHLGHWLQPGHQWQELDGPYYPKMKVEHIPNHLKKLQDQIKKDDWPHPRQRLVISDKATDQMLGEVSWYWQSKETNWLSVGIVIYDPAYWQQGLGFEALGLWCDYLLQAMPQLARLDLRTWSGNIGMMRLAEKLGFKEEARFRDARIVNGTFYDSMGYGILRSEWIEQQHQGFMAHLA